MLNVDFSSFTSFRVEMTREVSFRRSGATEKSITAECGFLTFVRNDELDVILRNEVTKNIMCCEFISFVSFHFTQDDSRHT